MYAGLDLLKPLIVQSDEPKIGRALLGTVKGDLHDIGKNLTGMMLEGAGFEIKDLGRNVPVDKFVEEVREWKPDVLGMSALLTTHTMVNNEGHHRGAEGGRPAREGHRHGRRRAPISQKYADEIGADLYGPDAAEAVKRCKAEIKARKG